MNKPMVPCWLVNPPQRLIELLWDHELRLQGIHYDHWVLCDIVTGIFARRRCSHR